MTENPNGNTPRRTIRVSDPLWDQFAQVAADRHTTPSEMIRQFMRRTVERHKKGDKEV